MAQAFKAKRLMGVFALVFGLIALSATAAQAEPGAFWRIQGSATTDGLNAQLQTDMEGAHLVLLTKVGLSKVEILCPQIKFVDMLMKTLGRILGKIHYEECLTKLNGSVANACKPHSPGAASGLWETNFLIGLIKLHEVSPGNRVDLVELLPHSGSFVTLVLGTEGKSECSIGEKFDITGKLVFKDCQNELLVEKVSHLWEEGLLSGLKFGANAMTIDGSFDVFLIGPHEGMLWSGVAN